MSLIKSPEDIKGLRRAGALLTEVLDFAVSLAVPGAILRDIDKAVHDKIVTAGAKPSFLGFDGYPNATCLSLNAEVVHGIPDGRKLKDGDVLGIDIGLWLNSLCVDAARTIIVGEGTPEALRLIKQTSDALQAGIQAAKPGRRVGAISSAIQQSAENNNLGIVRALTGHGVGHKVHEEPEIPNFGRANDGMLLRAGMVVAIEPMLTLGSGSVYTDVDGWTVVTADKSLSAQQEHTVIITPRGAEIIAK